MIRAPFDRPDVLRKLRPVFQAGPIKSLLLPSACDRAGLSTSLRFERFEVAHRGNYQIAKVRDRALETELRRFAEAICASPLRSGKLRLQRFRRGGYSLFQDDALTRIESGIELMLDLSRTACGAPAVYQRFSEKLLVPQMPGLVALVERTRELHRHDRYLAASVGRGEVLRLRAAFAFA